MSIYKMAREYAEEPEAVAIGADWAVTWLVALVGMAEAIRSGDMQRRGAEAQVEKEAKAREMAGHVCGLSGFNPMLGDTCAACVRWRHG